MTTTAFHSITTGAAFSLALLGAAVSITAAQAAPAPPNPCKLATVAEIEQIVGPLKSAPRATDPKSGEITCAYEPAKGRASSTSACTTATLPHGRKATAEKTR